MLDAPDNGLTTDPFGRAGRRGVIVCLVLALLIFAISADRADATTGTATISGTVYDSTHNPITSGDICVWATPVAGGGSGGMATSNSSGGYTISGLPSASYYVYFYDCYTSARNDVSQYYGGALDESAATPVTVGSASQSAIDATLPAGTTISGHVYGGTGTSTPLSRACVGASSGFLPNGQYTYGSATTASDGSYTMGHLLPGVAYTVSFQSCGAGTQYALQYYNDAADSSHATTVTPTLSAPVTGIDGHLVASATITGTVYDANNAPITSQDICLEATDANTLVGFYFATTNSSGDYSISGLAPGSYYVEFSDCPGSTRNDVSQYYLAESGAPYSGTVNELSSTPVVVASGGQSTGVDATLAVGDTISGTVYGGTGTAQPLAQICAGAQGTTGASYYGESDSSGDYTISHIAPSASGYDVDFRDCNAPTTYMPQYYNSSGQGTNLQSSATPVLSRGATNASGIDANLVAGGTISGEISDLSGNPITYGMCVTAYLKSGTGVQGESGYDDSAVMPGGDYTIGGLIPGSYRVDFSDCSQNSRNDLPLQLNSVTVASGATTTANATLQPATTISGTVDGCSQSGPSLSNSQIVYGCTGTETPLAGACVDAEPTPGGGSLQAISATDGTYTVTHVDPAVRYLIQFFACGSPGYEVQYYDNVSTATLATPISSSVAAPATGVNASLPYGAPVATVTGGPADGSTTSAPDTHFSFKANVAGSTFQCSVDGGKFKFCASPYDTGTLAAGSHTFSVKALAYYGQIKGSPATLTWTIDPTATSTTSYGTLAAGQTFSSDSGGAASAAVPVIVGLTSPAAADVTVVTQPATTLSGNGYTIFGQQVDIAAVDPSGTGSIAGTASNPIVLSFVLDGSQVPAGTNLQTVTVTRNGSPAADCTTPGIASPDPCVESRAATSDFGVKLVVLTTQCSTWNFAAPTHTSTTTTPVTTSTPATTTTPVPTVTTPPSVKTLPTKAEVLAALESILTPKGKAATVAAVRKHADYALAFKAPSAGQLVVDWYYLPPGARLPKRSKKAKAELVGSARLHALLSGRYSVTLKLNGAGRGLLAHGQQLKLTAYASFTPSGGALTSATKSFTLKK